MQMTAVKILPHTNKRAVHSKPLPGSSVNSKIQTLQPFTQNPA